MKMSSLRDRPRRRIVRRAVAPVGCALTLACLAQAPAALGGTAAVGGGGQLGTGGDVPGVSATLEQCVTVGEQAERSATFYGEMTEIAGATRMMMRIDVQERMPGEASFHLVSAPGLGVWRGSDPGVKIYKYVKQVTDLSSPALYRAVVRFHWLSAKGHLLKRAAMLTPTCVQPLSEPAMPTAPGSSSTTPDASTPVTIPSSSGS
jgi:hypothetical protein